MYFAAAIFAATVSLGQSGEMSPTHEHLEVLAPLVGEWKHEGVLKEDLAGLPAGSNMLMEWKFSWSLKSAVLRWQWTISSDGKRIMRGVERLGWNAKEKKIISTMFCTDGSMDTSHWSTDAKRFVSHYTGAQADGTEFSGEVVITLLDENTLTWQAVGYTFAGKGPSDSLKYKFTRQ